MERLMNSAWHVQRPRRDVVPTAAPLARGRAGRRRFFPESRADAHSNGVVNWQKTGEIET